MKGQISLDLIFTLIAIFIFLSGIVLISQSLTETQEDILLKNKLRIMGSNYASFINKSQILYETTYTAKLKLDHINYKGKRYYPQINFLGDRIRIKIDDSIPITSEHYISNLIESPDLKIYVQNTDLVITNA
jgi:hypothetical protein